MQAQEDIEGACYKTHPSADRFFWDYSSETHLLTTGINQLRNRKKTEANLFSFLQLRMQLSIDENQRRG